MNSPALWSWVTSNWPPQAALSHDWSHGKLIDKNDCKLCSFFASFLHIFRILCTQNHHPGRRGVVLQFPHRIPAFFRHQPWRFFHHPKKVKKIRIFGFENFFLMLMFCEKSYAGKRVTRSEWHFRTRRKSAPPAQPLSGHQCPRQPKNPTNHGKITWFKIFNENFFVFSNFSAHKNRPAPREAPKDGR